MSNKDCNKSTINFKIAINTAVKDCTNNIQRLLILYIFLIISITLISYNVETGTYNKISEYERALLHVENKQFTFTTKYDENGNIIGEYVDENFRDELSNQNEGVVIGYQTYRYIFPNFKEEYNTMYGDVADAALLSYLYQPVVAVNSLSDVPCNILAGTIEDQNDNGILVPDFLADFIMESGLFRDDLLEYDDLLDTYLKEMTDTYYPTHMSSKKIVGIYETGMSEVLKETKIAKRNIDETLRILDQYTIYFENSDGFEIIDNAVFIDGSDELALELLLDYDISRNIVFQSIDNMSSLNLSFGIFTIGSILLALIASFVFFKGTTRNNNTIIDKTNYNLLDITKLYLIEILLISVFTFIASILAVNFILYSTNMALGWQTGSNYNLLHLVINDYVLIFIILIIVNILGVILPIRSLAKKK